MNRASILPSGVVFEGTLEGTGDLVVRGTVVGSIQIDGALWIEAGGVVRGHVQARVVTVRGVLKGNAFGDEAVRVSATAKLIGDLTAPRVQVVPGARFKGAVFVESPNLPLLDRYDPAEHTLAGQEAPEVEAPIGAPTVVGQPAPTFALPASFPDTLARATMPSPPRLDTPPGGTLRAPPPDKALAPLPFEPAAHVTLPSPPMPGALADAESDAQAPRLPKVSLRMPSLGRARGKRRTDPR